MLEFFKSFLRRIKSLFGFGTRAGVSETSKVRHRLAQYCVGDGIDVGYGGDPVLETAIAMDLPLKYAAYASKPQHLHGDAANLLWFREGVLDYVYSSHVLEDFEDTEAVLREWIRVLRVGGRVVLFLPDESAYRAYCQSQGKPPNAHHVHDDFGAQYLKQVFQRIGGVQVVHEDFPVGIYSFEMVIEKNREV
ncbi:MAG: SAM-dependent methyltransferase [Crocinitomicaceae bacterium]|jgi:SAM-dependent methyltransferase